MRYLITGVFGIGSLGDELILSSELDIFKRNNCTVASHNPSETTDMHEVNSIPYTTADISKFDDYDCLIIGGGAVFLRHWARVHYEHSSIAVKKGKKVRVFNVGVMDDVEDWDLAKKIFEMSDKFSVRSKASFDSLKLRTGCEPEIDGFYSKYCKKASKKRIDEILNSSGIDTSKILIGIQCKNVESVIRYYTPICKRLLENENIELIGINTFIPKVDEKNRDSTAIDTINSMIGENSMIAGRQIKKINGQYNGLLHPHEMKGLLAELDYLIVNRKHPAITAESEGVKVFLVDNDGAIGRVKEYINSTFYVDINIDNDPNKLIEKLINSLIGGYRDPNKLIEKLINSLIGGYRGGK